MWVSDKDQTVVFCMKSELICCPVSERDLEKLFNGQENDKLSIRDLK